jgi:uncharacterized protein (UPF0179 family)
MVIITLIGEHQAKEGEGFVYKGPLTECRECKLKGVCFNLDAGSAYKITVIRDVHHECRIHEEGVRVVEVEKVPVSCAVGQKSAHEGSIITLEGVKCRNLGCERYRLCYPAGVERNTKYKVTKVKGDIECPEGGKIVEVELG